MSDEAVDLKALISEVFQRPEDVAARSVLSDKLQELGIEAAGGNVGVLLRDEKVSLELMNALAALRVLFGVSSHTNPNLVVAGAYTSVLGFGYDTIRALETVSLDAETQNDFIARKLILPKNCSESLIVHELKFGRWHAFAGSGSVPGELFSMDGPEVFETHLKLHTKIRLTLQNISNTDLQLGACILGDERPLRDPSTPQDSRLMAGDPFQQLPVQPLERGMFPLPGSEDSLLDRIENLTKYAKENQTYADSVRSEIMLLREHARDIVQRLGRLEDKVR